MLATFEVDLHRESGGRFAYPSIGKEEAPVASKQRGWGVSGRQAASTALSAAAGHGAPAAVLRVCWRQRQVAVGSPSVIDEEAPG